MSIQRERIEARSVENGKQDLTVIDVRGPAGIFGRGVVVVAAIFLFALAFVFSLIVFAILAASALMLLAYAWWVSRRAPASSHVIRRR